MCCTGGSVAERELEVLRAGYLYREPHYFTTYWYQMRVVTSFTNFANHRFHVVMPFAASQLLRPRKKADVQASERLRPGIAFSYDYFLNSLFLSVA